MKPAPTLHEVAEQLHGLLSGRAGRRQVSLWAAQWLTDPDVYVEDDTVRSMLERLGAADLTTTDRDFLYVETDFHLWLDQVENAISASQ